MAHKSKKSKTDTKILIFIIIIGIFVISACTIKQRTTVQADKESVKESREIESEKIKKLNEAEANRKGVVTFIDDDSSYQFYKRWKPILDDTGIKISEAVNTSFVGTSGYMTLDELKQLKAEGNDILSHGYTHPNLNTLDLANIEDEWKGSRQYLIDNKLGDDLALVYPTGLYSITDKNKKEKVKELTKKYFKYGIDANSGDNAFPNMLPIHDNYEVNRVFVDPATVTLADVKPYIDNSYKTKKWLIFLTHCGISWDDTNTPTHFKEIINYTKGLDMPILNFRDGEKLISSFEFE